VIPLIVERGASVTTADIASAAGVAEGTIYSVFPDKATLIGAAVEVALDAEPVRASIRAIDAGRPLEDQLAEAAKILIDRFGRVVALVSLLRSMAASSTDTSERARAAVSASNADVADAVEELLRRHRSILRIEPEVASAAFSGLIVAGGYPLLPPDRRLDIPSLVDIFLRGIAAEQS
jgi:AcrR family transcriptional regulator